MCLSLFDWVLFSRVLLASNSMYVYMVKIEEAKKAYLEAYIRVMALDNVRQVQVARFIYKRPH